MPDPTDDQTSAAEMIREYRDGGPDCSECEELLGLRALRAQVGELEEWGLARRAELFKVRSSDYDRGLIGGYDRMIDKLRELREAEAPQSQPADTVRAGLNDRGLLGQADEVSDDGE